MVCDVNWLDYGIWSIDCEESKGTVMSDKVKLGFMTVVVAFLFVLVPLLIIISINVLFETTIPLTWQTWLATLVLINAVRWSFQPKITKGE